MYAFGITRAKITDILKDILNDVYTNRIETSLENITDNIDFILENPEYNKSVEKVLKKNKIIFN